MGQRVGHAIDFDRDGFSRIGIGFVQVGHTHITGGGASRVADASHCALSAGDELGLRRCADVHTQHGEGAIGHIFDAFGAFVGRDGEVVDTRRVDSFPGVFEDLVRTTGVNRRGRIDGDVHAGGITWAIDLQLEARDVVRAERVADLGTDVHGLARIDHARRNLAATVHAAGTGGPSGIVKADGLNTVAVVALACIGDVTVVVEVNAIHVHEFDDGGGGQIDFGRLGTAVVIDLEAAAGLVVGDDQLDHRPLGYSDATGAHLAAPAEHAHTGGGALGVSGRAQGRDRDVSAATGRRVLERRCDVAVSAGRQTSLRADVGADIHHPTGGQHQIGGHGHSLCEGHRRGGRGGRTRDRDVVDINQIIASAGCVAETDASSANREIGVRDRNRAQR